MASVNKVILIGNLGKDPEMRYTPSGSAICSLRIATTRSWKNKESGERVEETEWHSVVMYERLAEVAGEYLRKGRSVYIEGRLRTRKWQDKEGVDRYTTEIVTDEMKMLGGREDNGGGGGGGGRSGGGTEYGDDMGGGGGGSGGYSPAPAPRAAAPRPAAPPRAPAPAPAPRPAPAPAPKSSTGFDDMDDDIPF